MKRILLTFNITVSGSISINTRPRGKQPREIPQFPQRATGSAWNQALREVGFDYGTTFQDMDNIRFDGKRYHTACTTNIKQVVDESLGESRYVLHPACIDSTLQLCITAIYAGRTNAMDCGMVPVQVDEVAIWPPTEQQLEAKKGNAYSIVHQRGIRTTESTVQMTAEDGEMIMEIVNMRAIAYEAAVPQKSETALEHSPYGEMSWELDFDVAENRDGLETSQLVNLALFKYPGLKSIELGTNTATAILSQNPQAFYTVVALSDEEAEAASAIIAGYHNAKVVKIDTTQDLEPQGLKTESYDILITSGEGDLVSKLHELVKSDAITISSKVTISKLVSGRPASGNHSVQLVYRSIQSSIVSSIKTKLESLSWDVTITALDASVEADIGEHVIMLADFEGPLLFTLTDEEFNALKNIIAKASSLLWVSTGATLEGKKPEYAMVAGLARAVTAEQASLDFRTLDIDTESVNPEQITRSIARVAQLQVNKSEELPEREFCVSKGKTYISRLIRNEDLNDIYTSYEKAQPERFVPKSHISGKILKGKVVFQHVDPIAAIQPGYVEVEVQSCGLTKEGVLAITGSDYATTFSHEIGGQVVRIGSGVTSLKVGDRVVGFHVDRFDSYQQVPVSMLQKLEPREDMIEVVSILTAYSTALYGLETLASTKEGDIVLILDKTGFAGTAAIKIAQLKGAIPYVTVRTNEEANFLQEKLGIQPRFIIKASDGPISERIEQLTNGHGADVVFSAGSVAAGAAREAWRCIAPFGRFLDSGRKDNLSRNILDGIPVRRNAIYMPYDIIEIYNSRLELLSKLLPIIVDYSRLGLTSIPSAIQAVNLASIDKAVSAFSDAFNAVKSVIQYQPSEGLIQVLPARKRLRFSPTSTYLLIGCLGGLGRSLTSWMMESGARRFTFLSRSGADSKPAAKLVSDLEAAGAFVQIVRGDATTRADVVRAVEGVSSQHPIKGVVHAAMVLRVSCTHSITQCQVYCWDELCD